MANSAEDSNEISEKTDTLKYFRNKSCACCSIRFDKLPRRSVTRVQDDIDFINKLNTVKPIILSNKRKLNDFMEIKKNDLICASCRLYTKKFKSDNVQINSSNIYPSLDMSSVEIAMNQVHSYSSYSAMPLPSTSTASTSHSSTQTVYNILPSTSRRATPTLNEYYDDNIGKIETMTLKIPRSIINNKNCIICNKSNNVINLPREAFLDTYINYEILIPKDTKCCTSHLNRKNIFHKKCIKEIEIVSNYTTLDSNEVRIFLDCLRESSKNNLFKKFSKADRMDDTECKRLTSLRVNDFNIVLDTMKSLKNSPTRNKSQALGTYLFWLRTGLDHRTIASLLSIENHQSVGEYCEQARKSLLNDFVPNNLGVSHLTRDEWTRQKTVFSTELFNVNNDQLILIADGTYLYTEKSDDNELQRESWSQQKGTHLTKPFVICTPNGKIVDIYGLHSAKKNDATILKNILSLNKDLRTLLRPNDHIILDRGFRDAIDTLKNKYHLTTHMPVCKSPRQKQLNTLQANESRLTTKTRYMVEIINGKLTNPFRANGKVHRNIELSHSLDDYRIAGALVNRFFTLHTPNTNDVNIATLMKTRLTTVNRLENLLSTYNIDKTRKDFQKMTASSIPDFPRFTIDHIANNITFGPYTIKQAQGYIKENFNNPENSIIELYKDQAHIFGSDTLL